MRQSVRLVRAGVRNTHAERDTVLLINQKHGIPDARNQRDARNQGCDSFRSSAQKEIIMNSIVYIVGAIVIVVAILSLLGLG